MDEQKSVKHPKKGHWRKNPDGHRVWVDTDPSNDYMDGYNAGLRAAKENKQEKPPDPENQG